SLSELFELNISNADVALLAQAAEVRIGLNCGLMDQYAVLESKRAHCLLLDCQNLEFDFLPADFQDCSIVLLNTNIKHHLADSAYNHRRLDVERALSKLKNRYPQLGSPRDVDFTMLRDSEDLLSEIEIKRLSFVLEENERVLSTCEALKAGDMEKVGQLMNESHVGLSTKYEVSCPELDFLAAFAQQKDYVQGSRMMGGGFGGCTINLVKNGYEERFISEAAMSYKSSMNLDATHFIVSIGEGVCQV
ncbi:UNVERIFIED_CONTAM: hypothetical protein GTU68_035779, partial [Idotea baltica]|nr:hypothetical protein [Idotea baltica]